jgi:hypothetical protein
MYTNGIPRISTLAVACAQVYPGMVQVVASSSGNSLSDPNDPSSALLNTSLVVELLDAAGTLLASDGYAGPDASPCTHTFSFPNLPNGTYTLRLTTEAGRQQQRTATVAC